MSNKPDNILSLRAIKKEKIKNISGLLTVFQDIDGFYRSATVYFIPRAV